MHKVHDVFGRITEKETHARRDCLHSFRLIAGHGLGGDELAAALIKFDASCGLDSSLSEIYALFTSDQRSSLRHMVENPAVRVIRADKSEWWIEERLDLLRRLEEGEFVGSVNQTQVERKPGDIAFVPNF